MRINISDQLDKTLADSDEIFLDKFVLEEEFEPDIVFHRDSEISEILHFFKSIKEGSKRSIDLCGKSGTGKTLIVKKALNAFSKRIGDSIKTIYINCSDEDTKSRIIKRIAIELKGDWKIGWGTDDHLRTIDAHLGSVENVMVVLDEIDKVLRKDGDKVLYLLSNRPKMSLINISNVPLWRKYISDQRVVSRMQPNQILFSPYSEQEIYDILTYRVKKALKPGTYTKETLRDIATGVGFSSGDMRKALDMLRRSAEYARMTKKTIIDKICLSFVERRQEIDTTIDFIQGLPGPHKAILVLIFDYWKNTRAYLDINNIRGRYNELAKDSKHFKPLTLETVRNYVMELCTYELVERIGGSGLGRGRGREAQKFKILLDTDLFEREIYNRIKRQKN